MRDIGERIRDNAADIHPAAYIYTYIHMNYKVKT